MILKLIFWIKLSSLGSYKTDIETLNVYNMHRYGIE